MDLGQARREPGVLLRPRSSRPCAQRANCQWRRRDQREECRRRSFRVRRQRQFSVPAARCEEPRRPSPCRSFTISLPDDRLVTYNSCSHHGFLPKQDGVAGGTPFQGVDPTVPTVHDRERQNEEVLALWSVPRMCSGALHDRGEKKRSFCLCHVNCVVMSHSLARSATAVASVLGSTLRTFLSTTSGWRPTSEFGWWRTASTSRLAARTARSCAACRTSFSIKVGLEVSLSPRRAYTRPSHDLNPWCLARVIRMANASRTPLQEQRACWVRMHVNRIILKLLLTRRPYRLRAMRCATGVVASPRQA